MSRHYITLRNYFFAIASDLVARGVVRKAQGQTIESVLRNEIRAVLQDVEGELLALGQEIGITLASGAIGAGEGTLRRTLDEGIDAVKEGLFDLIAGRKKPPPASSPPPRRRGP